MLPVIPALGGGRKRGENQKFKVMSHSKLTISLTLTLRDPLYLKNKPRKTINTSSGLFTLWEIFLVISYQPVRPENTEKVKASGKGRCFQVRQKTSSALSLWCGPLGIRASPSLFLPFPTEESTAGEVQTPTELSSLTPWLCVTVNASRVFVLLYLDVKWALWA